MNTIFSLTEALSLSGCSFANILIFFFKTKLLAKNDIKRKAYKQNQFLEFVVVVFFYRYYKKKKKITLLNV